MQLQTIAKRENSKGKLFALCYQSSNDTYSVWVLSENYDSHVRGGIRKTWKWIEQNMTEEAATALFNRRTNK